MRMFSLCHRKEGGEVGIATMRKEFDSQQEEKQQPAKKKQKKGKAAAKKGDEGKIALFEAPGKESIEDEGILLAYRLFCLAGVTDKAVSKSMTISKVADNKITRTVLSYIYLEGRKDFSAEMVVEEDDGGEGGAV